MNGNMQLVLVEGPALAREFIAVATEIYRNDPHWIRPLDKDINEVFDPSKNKAFQQGEAVRWILKDGNGKSIGRIAAFVQAKYKNKGDEFPVGCIGFFECIHDQQAANLLFDKAKNWLQDKGVEAMDGPINFGERDKFWGLMLEGFYEPLYGMNYNPPYYQELFENYGFEVFYNQICWILEVMNSGGQLQPKFYEAHKRFAGKKGYKAIHVNKKNLDQFARDFCTIYNKAWAGHEGNKEMSEAAAIKLFRSMKPVMDEKLGWFTYYNDEPIAMWMNIPDLNQIFKHLNGQFNWWAKLKFLYYKSTGACNRMVGIIYGIIPKFQGTGVDYYMIVEAEKTIKPLNRYNEIELLWQGDFNPKILNISKNLGARQSRRLATLRYQFDRSRPFKRHPIL